MSHLTRSSGSGAAGIGRPVRLLPVLSAGLATIDAPYGIPSPGNDPAFQPGGKYASYFTAYASAHGAAAGPANCYAEFWHENAIDGKQYGFTYDDDANQSSGISVSSDISVANPQYMIVAIGW
jgi:hypothetical protein